MKILHLEDDPMLARAIGRMLKGHDVTHITEAPDEIDPSYDLVISDWDLGTHTAERIIDKHPWIVFFSSSEIPPGNHAIVPKPDFEALLKVVTP